MFAEDGGGVGTNQGFQFCFVVELVKRVGFVVGN